jgi:hypothetical protein
MGKRGEQKPPGQVADRDAPSPGAGREGKPPFPVHEHVGRRLREMFDEVTTQPIPDKFLKLLEDLDHAQSGEPPSDQTGPAPSKPKRKPRKSK